MQQQLMYIEVVNHILTQLNIKHHLLLCSLFYKSYRQIGHTNRDTGV